MSIQINKKELSEMFIGNKQVSEIYLGTKMIFSNTSNNVQYIKGNTGKYYNTNVATILDKNNKNMKKIKIKTNIIVNGYETLTKGIANYGFDNCKNLTDVIIETPIPPNSTKTKEFIFGDGCLYFCNKLKNIVIPDCPCTVGERAFQEDISLESFILKEDSTSKTESYIGSHAFNGCKKLSKVIIPKGYKVMNTPFAYCNPDLLYVYVRNTKEETISLGWSASWNVYDGLGYGETYQYLPHIIYGYTGE